MSWRDAWRLALFVVCAASSTAQPLPREPGAGAAMAEDSPAIRGVKDVPSSALVAADRLFTMLDRDGDRVLSAGELTLVSRRNLPIDRDGDGRISSEEFRFSFLHVRKQTFTDGVFRLMQSLELALLAVQTQRLDAAEEELERAHTLKCRGNELPPDLADNTLARAEQVRQELAGDGKLDARARAVLEQVQSFSASASEVWFEAVGLTPSESTEAGLTSSSAER